MMNIVVMKSMGTKKRQKHPFGYFYPLIHTQQLPIIQRVVEQPPEMNKERLRLSSHGEAASRFHRH